MSSYGNVVGLDDNVLSEAELQSPISFCGRSFSAQQSCAIHEIHLQPITIGFPIIIVLYFFNPTFAYVFFDTAPVRDLGGAAGPDIGCETHCVVVGTTEAYCNMCFGIRRR